MIRLKALILLVLLLSLLIFIPRAQTNSVIEKYPTSTTQIYAGWIDPTEAYVKDDVPTTATTYGAAQEYSDFGFNFNESDAIEFVCAKVRYIWAWAYGIEWESWAGYVGVFNGSWVYLTIFMQDSETSTFVEQLIYLDAWLDWTPQIDGNQTSLNNLRVRLAYGGQADESLTYSVDVISVTVAYTTATSSRFYDGFFFGGLLCGMIAVVAILIIDRR